MEQSGIKHFALIGGDLRQAYLAEALLSNGDFADAVGFETYSFQRNVPKKSLSNALASATHVLLPLPVSRDRMTINAPFTETPIVLNDDLAVLLRGKTVLGGQIERLPHTETWQALSIYDYAQREDFLLWNAALTAEGAVVQAMSEMPVSLMGLRCLITGCGRIGKQLAVRLRDFGANVSVAARSPEALAWVSLSGMRPVHMRALAECGAFDLVFNTVPSLIWTQEALKQAAAEAHIYELASAPYGVDFSAAKRLNIPVTIASGIPGKYAPKTAAELLRKVIMEMLSEIP